MCVCVCALTCLPAVLQFFWSNFIRTSPIGLHIHDLTDKGEWLCVCGVCVCVCVFVASCAKILLVQFYLHLLHLEAHYPYE